ncbi:MAG TPA: YbaK/EbsC family protein [candidate division Zixibacteria bacterium]|nr:YbaK/EbsC family protein [candidate division Zixibacteria bacterium]
MPTQKLHAFLNDNQIKYLKIEHSPAYTAQEIAAAVHIPGEELAKSVMVKIDNKMTMVVLPANHRINFAKLTEETGASEVRLADESEFGDLFPDCSLGAMPPFGNLYGIEVIVDQTLAGDNDITFNACSHTELIQLSYRDFEILVKPRVLNFSW